VESSAKSGGNGLTGNYHLPATRKNPAVPDMTVDLNRLNWFTRLLYKLRGRDPVAEYYASLVVYGRVTEGRIVDLIVDLNNEDGRSSICYRYKIANVEYETSHTLTPAQIERGHLYVPGASISVRFDPKRPGISIVP